MSTTDPKPPFAPPREKFIADAEARLDGISQATKETVYVVKGHIRASARLQAHAMEILDSRGLATARAYLELAVADLQAAIKELPQV